MSHQPIGTFPEPFLPGGLPRAEFAFPGPLRDSLVASILAGRKTATTSLVVEYAVEGEDLPAVGSRQAVLDSDNEPVAVIETVQVEQLRLNQVPLAHVIAEGRGTAVWLSGGRTMSSSGTAGTCGHTCGIPGLR
ncbi:ASCH domain-containing protein [Arthrobacter sp. ATA002]|uniref:ASCH domain-containing protein n=1 Tax=Arthrobacter sp. ATA002 TaxID=2991715 RepID=UPI0022A7DDAB|nr:ASCH domain-containing protein [Arthrobacter sp. ATA002]WAP50587.1 ASCH domain-containing protein [Arthrobacter sp. ATA002]